MSLCHDFLSSSELLNHFQPYLGERTLSSSLSLNKVYILYKGRSWGMRENKIKPKVGRFVHRVLSVCHG